MSGQGLGRHGTTIGRGQHAGGQQSSWHVTAGQGELAYDPVPTETPGQSSQLFAV